MKFICTLNSQDTSSSSGVNIVTLISLGFFIASTIYMIIVCLVLCKKRNSCCFGSAEDRNLQFSTLSHEDRRILKEKKKKEDEEMKLTRLDEKIKKLDFANIQNNYKTTSCSICFDEFAKTTVVRETSCKHLFHDHCLFAWIKTKISQPDCPYCR